MFSKKIVCLIAGTMLGLPVMAHAGGDLTTINNTNFDSTCVINNGACSTIIGPGGITHAHSTNVVPSKKVFMACITNTENCRANVYMTNNCTGPVIATVVLSTTTGIKSVQMYDHSYNITGSGFTVAINGGS